MAIAMNGGRSKEGDGNGNDGSRWATVMETKRAIATAIRVAGNEEGNGDGVEANLILSSHQVAESISEFWDNI
jgi:hypothetical protein